MAGTEGEDELRSLLFQKQVLNLFEPLKALHDPCTKLVHLETVTAADFVSLRGMHGVLGRDVTVLENTDITANSLRHRSTLNGWNLVCQRLRILVFFIVCSAPNQSFPYA